MNGNGFKGEPQTHQYPSAFLDAPNLICYKNFFALAHGFRLCCGRLFRSSSMAEHPAVNRRVVSSSLTCGANFMFYVYVLENPQGKFYVGQTGNIKERFELLRKGHLSRVAFNRCWVK